MSHSRAERLRILAVDDDQSILDIYRQALSPERNSNDSSDLPEEPSTGPFGSGGAGLEATGYDLVLCRQGSEAVEWVRAAVMEGHPFAVAFIDIRMESGPSGVWTAQRIRELDPSVEIVVITASPDVDSSEVVHLVQPAENLLCFRKPFSSHEIRQVVSALGSKWKAVKQLQHMHVVLETQVRERTAELASLTERLKQDIQNRKEAEDALRASEERYRKIVENQAELICRFLPDGTLTFVNEAYSRYLGRRREELIGTNFLSLISEQDRDKVRMHLQRLDGGPEFLSCEYRVILADGRVRWQQWTDRAILDEHGSVIEIQSVGRDTTERRKAEEELLKAEKLESIGVLAGGIAHDFNNILTGVLGNISLAKEYSKPGETVYQRLAEAETAALRARDLTQQLLTFARGGTPIKTVTCISNIVKDSCDFALRGSSVRCEFHIPDDLWATQVDVGQMAHVMHHLLINADQAMPGGGVIEVHAENVAVDANAEIPSKPGSYVRITVKDHGVGIPQEHLPKIFDPYFTTKQRGSGLGLATVYSIINNHEGCIDVQSVLGVGTTFRIYLPAVDGAMCGRVEETGRNLRGRGKVLLMDDEELIRDIGGEMLSYLGYEVSVAGDGAEAVALYKEAMHAGRKFDAVIMDLTIPGAMGGEEAIRELLEVDPEVKAIVSSGYSIDRVMSNYGDYGFCDVVAKPYKVQEMGRVLDRLLCKKQERCRDNAFACKSQGLGGRG